MFHVRQWCILEVILTYHFITLMARTCRALNGYCKTLYLFQSKCPNHKTWQHSPISSLLALPCMVYRCRLHSTGFSKCHSVLFGLMEGKQYTRCKLQQMTNNSLLQLSEDRTTLTTFDLNKKTKSRPIVHRQNCKSNYTMFHRNIQESNQVAQQHITLSKLFVTTFQAMVDRTA